MQLTMIPPEEVLQGLSEVHASEEQLAILRTIKNSITGHELRKIEYVQAGLLLQLATILSDLRTHNRWCDEQEGENATNDTALWVHLVWIVNVIANTGAPFVTPILDSNIVQELLSGLEHIDVPRVQLSILRCLNTVVDNSTQGPDTRWTPDRAITAELYTQQNAAKLATILADDGCLAQQAGQAAMILIHKTCTTDKQRDVLVDAGVLFVLCDKLEHLVSTQKSCSGRPHTFATTLDIEAYLSLLLETLSTIVEGSRTHAKSLTIHARLTAAIDSMYRTSDHDFRSDGADFDIPLPMIPDHHSVSAARMSQFPPISASPAQKRRSSSLRTPQDRVVIEDHDRHKEQAESRIVLWLLSTVRNSVGRRRFAAARLLSILKHHGLMSAARTRSLGVLLVPILSQMLLTPVEHDAQGDYAYLVPSVLASIVRDNESSQRAAMETRAISRCISSLRRSFDNQDDVTVNLWWPDQLDQKLTDGEHACHLGVGGPSLAMRKTMIWRKGLLQALAAVVSDNESYRKELIEIGGLPHIVQALEPFSSTIQEHDTRDTVLARGNSPGVLIAACGAIRALTRSPTALRTKLVDADISKPIIKLLHTPEPEVRVAATMVLSNLAHDFSPMKQNIEPVLKKLCEQAHSANARLRYESLFALKAMVNGSKNELKRKIVEELGPNWIKHLAATDPHDVPVGEVIGLVPKDYRKGSMIRLVEKMEVDDETDDEYDAHSLEDDLSIQAELLAFLRNLTTGERPDEIVEFLLEHVGQDDFQQILLDRLKSASNTSQHAVYPTSIVSNTIYILVHLCAAEKKFRYSISANVPLMKTVSSLLGHNEADVRCAACWLVTNLIYVNNSDGFDAVMQRAKELMRLGVVNQIRRMEKTDPVMDVKERAATASECFSKLLSL